MVNRAKLIKVTKEYVQHFNARDLREMASLLDTNEVIFTRQSQPTIIGKNTIMNRTYRLFKRLRLHGQSLQMVNAIIDLPEMAASPCMIGVLDGEKFSVCFLHINANGMIDNITILLNKESVDIARTTEPDVLKEALIYEKQPARRELEKRAKGLRKKKIKLEHRIRKEGHTHELALKMARLKIEKKKLEVQLGKMAH